MIDISRPAVLIITYGFPPHIKSLGGAIRMLKLAEYLQKNNCSVHVLCARTPHIDTFGYDELLASLSITRVNDPIAKLGARIFTPDTEADASRHGATIVQRIKSWIKRLALEALTPDTAILTIRGLRRRAQELSAAQSNLTVITSGPPHSIHLVGRALKSIHPTVNWILDYRDSWNGTSLFRKRNPMLQWLNKSLESSVLSRCDYFSYISTPMLDKAQAFSREDLSTKAKLIANGFDAGLLLATKAGPRQTGPLRIGYFGAIDDAEGSYRNPTSILEAIFDRPDLDVRIELYGSISISPHWMAQLGERLLVGPRLAHHDAIGAMLSMDALLLLHTREDGADEVVTGKVFEYIATRLPIISIGPDTMAVNELLATDPSSFKASHLNKDAITGLIADLIERKRIGALPTRDAELINSFTRESQFDKFLQLINEHAHVPKHDRA